MGTSKESALDDISSQSSQLRQDHSDTRGNDLDAVGGESRLSTMAEQVEKTVNAESKKQPSAPDQKGVMRGPAREEVPTDGVQSIPHDGVQFSGSNDHKTLLAVNHEKKEQQSQNPESQSDQSLVTHVPGVSSQKTDSLQDKLGSPVSVTRTSDVPQQTQSADSKTPTSESCKGGSVVTVKYEMSSDTLPQIQSPNAACLQSQSNQLALAYSSGSEKYLDKLQPRRNPDTIVQLSQSTQGSVSSLTPEKPSEDGYNWRKYGQKLVKGNEFVRSYYKCTYPNCLAKKQVERSNVGHITDINYLGNHEHPKPQQVPQIGATLVQPIQARKPDSPIMSTPEADKPSVSCVEMSKPEPVEVNLPLAIVSSEAVGGSTSDDIGNTSGRDAKKQKRDISASDDPMLNKHCSEARHVVQTRSEVDLVNDGYRWRKYGQKLVKGNPNPRSYYRCSNAGCPVKKHVERASHDPKLVITTYEGQHDHDMPGSRTVTQKVSEGDVTIAAMTGESRSEPGDSKHNGLDRVIHIGAN